MADLNRGLDLSVFETATDAESDSFRSFYRDKLGTPHRGLNFWLDVDRPDVLKRYRAYADDGTPGGLETVRKVGGFRFFVSYAMSGYAAGIRYLVHMHQSMGFSRSQILEGLAVAFLYNGPRGSQTVAEALDGYAAFIDVVRYAFVNDFGTVINPLTVNGQAHGGIVQGIGKALREHVVYDQEGQLLTGSYMDYALPRADDAPLFTHAFHPVPAKTNVLGAKGCGEAGCAGALPSVMNALVDALGEYGIRHLDMPATPERVWRAIREARGPSSR